MFKQNSNSNFNQVLWLGISQVSTFLVSFLSGVILSRYLSKGDYGTYRQVLFIYNILFSIFSSGLASAYSFFVPRLSEGEAKNIVNKITSILVLFGLIISAGLYIFSGLIAQALNNCNLEESLKLFCLTPLFTLPTLGIESLYTALRKTKVVAIYQIVGKLLILLCCVLPVVIFNKGYLEAIMGWTVASFFSFLFAFFLKWFPFRSIQAVAIDNVYSKISNYAMPLIGACLAGLLMNSAAQFFISRYWGAANYADYANGYIGLPFVVMVAGPLKAVLQPIFSKASHEGNINYALSVYENGLLQCVTILFPLIIFSFVFADEIMAFVYGQKYISSAPFFRLSLLLDISKCFPYLAIILAFGNTRPYLWAHIISVIVIWLVDYLVYRLSWHSIFYAVVYTVAELTIVLSMILYILRKYKLNIISKQIVIKCGLIIIHSIAIACLTYYAISQIELSMSSTFLQLSTGFTLFVIILILSGRYMLKIDYLGIVVDRIFKNIKRN